MKMMRSAGVLTFANPGKELLLKDFNVRRTTIITRPGGVLHHTPPEEIRRRQGGKLPNTGWAGDVNQGRGSRFDCLNFPPSHPARPISRTLSQVPKGLGVRSLACGSSCQLPSTKNL